jgi:hypothetical protein
MAVVFLIVSKMVIYVEESLGNGRTISEAKLTASSAKDRTQPSLPAVGWKRSFDETLDQYASELITSPPIRLPKAL